MTERFSAILIGHKITFKNREVSLEMNEQFTNTAFKSITLRECFWQRQLSTNIKPELIKQSQHQKYTRKKKGRMRKHLGNSKTQDIRMNHSSEEDVRRKKLFNEIIMEDGIIPTPCRY